jgi:hypothetical protein
MHNRDEHNRPPAHAANHSLSVPERPLTFKALIDQFIIHTSNGRSVTMTLPSGLSRFDFLVAAQGAVRDLFGADLIDSDLLPEWRMSKRFAEASLLPRTIAVEIEIDSLQGHRRDEHALLLNARGCALASYEDTAVAFAAFWIATGSDLFAGTAVQTSYKGLQLNDEGLVDIDLHRARSVALVRRPPRTEPFFSSN